MTIAPQPESKDVTVRLRITSAEQALWLDAADQDKMSLSQWIRRRCEGLEAAAPDAERLRRRRSATQVLGTDLEDELVQRAIRMFMRDTGEQPSRYSAVREINGQPYVELFNTRGVLGYYQIIGPSRDGKFRLKLDEEMDESRAKRLDKKAVR